MAPVAVAVENMNDSLKISFNNCVFIGFSNAFYTASFIA